MIIRPLSDREKAPYDLLMLADPSKSAVDDYVQRGICHVAVVQGEFVGVYVLLKTRPHTMELVNVAVKKELQGQGIGKQLVCDAIREAAKFGVKTLEVGTGNSSLSQLALYQKCGFRISGIDHDFFKNHYTEEIFENGIECIDMVRLSINLISKE